MLYSGLYYKSSSSLIPKANSISDAFMIEFFFLKWRVLCLKMASERAQNVHYTRFRIYSIFYIMVYYAFRRCAYQ